MVDVLKTGPSDYGTRSKVLVCGFPGSKLSLLASTWKNPVILTTESLMLLSDKETPYIPIKCVQDLEDSLTAFKNSEIKADSVILYTLDEIQRMMVRERKAYLNKSSLSFSDNDQLKEEFRALLAGFRNLDLNILFLSHLKLAGDEDTGHIFKSGLQGTLADEVVEYVDIAVVMKILYSVKFSGDLDHIQRVATPYLQCYPDAQYPWIRDDTQRLPSEFKVNFEDDFKRLTFYTHEKQIQGPSNEKIQEPSKPVKDFGQERDRLVNEAKTALQKSEEPTTVKRPRGRPKKNPDPIPVAVVEPQKEIEPEVEPKPPEWAEGAENASDALNEEELKALLDNDDVPLEDIYEEEASVAIEDVQSGVPQETVQSPGTGVIEQCQGCHANIEDADQILLSKLRFHMLLCRTCFIEKKKA